jgi:peptidoglycan hydrolase-like protein with peptidoglycan-binding domain
MSGLQTHMNIKHITAGLLMTLLVAPTTIIAYETYGFSYQPTDPDAYTTVASVDERISELYQMIAALEAEKQDLVAAREVLLSQDDTRSMINEILKQMGVLQGEWSDAPVDSELRDELQQQINDLLNQVAELQADLGNPESPTVCPYTWTRNLSVGDRGADVLALQQFLNADPDTKITNDSHVVSTETDEYHAGVAAAISKFQVKYRADVLSPQGLVNPTGEFDEQTRAKANALCVAAPTQPDEATIVQDTDGDGWIYGTDENDRYEGNDTENILVGSSGNDIMDGGSDWDEVNYVGQTDCLNNFSITYNDNGSVIIESRKYGTDTLRNIEGVYFAGCGDWLAL